MSYDFSKADQNLSWDCDVCIIGTGVAGISVAKKLLEITDSKVLLIDSGNALHSAYSSISGEIGFEGSLKIKATSRFFGVGGSSNKWGGVCARFDQAELDRSAFDLGAKWPITHEQLSEYYDDAELLLGVKGVASEKVESPLFTDFQTRTFMATQPPINFKDLARGHILSIVTNAHVVTMESEGDVVTTVLARSRRHTHTLKINAKEFVLAAGGLESIRTVLDALDRGALKNASGYDVAGSYFMNHPKRRLGKIEFKQGIEVPSALIGSLKNGIASYVGISQPSSVSEARGLLSPYLRLEPIYEWTNNIFVSNVISRCHGTSRLMLSFLKSLNIKLILLDMAESGEPSTERKGNSPVGYSDIKALVLYAYHRLLGIRAKTRSFYVVGYFEMEPRSQNRVFLAGDVDALGLKCFTVDYCLSPVDLESMSSLLAYFLERCGDGLVSFDEIQEEHERYIVEDASHHIGGLRMGMNPATSFVDDNLKVHGVRNLFVVGSSVFPTSGSVNPTSTIVALALRLGDHIAKHRLKGVQVGQH